ncbi:M3 family oligoendopeptidase [Scopulibacillus daqui]|uniref:M3 family oligoendopeptidase n=1 Tax=Scopulibacillus daqui TaxID=1469162 RepID=A0ABS2PX08_9BACL|nr:M3 family oligoendopeptidase [Scopulibacillus daqui]MBM7644471.1 M3 family oligoendopeptidase [Scopulibacillus daqui]
MSGLNHRKSYYLENDDLKDVNKLEDKLKALVKYDIRSITELEKWLAQERVLNNEIQETMIGHKIDFYRDTANPEKRDIHMYDQSIIRPILLKYQAELDKKFCDCPFAGELDASKYGFVRQARRTKVELFRKENIQLAVREKEIGAKYSEIMGGLSIDWEGEKKSYSFVKAQLDHQDRTIRERAWRALAEARSRVKAEIDEMMNELVKLRHQTAVNAGFDNYCDYMFRVKNRAYHIQQCYNFQSSVEKHIIPSWKRLSDGFRKELGVDKYRPWDSSVKVLERKPFSTVHELMEGIQIMLGKTDPYFEEQFKFMRENGLLDLECRIGKYSGCFMDPLPASKKAFVFANFSPSFAAVIALIHEMGHAVNVCMQFANDPYFQEEMLRDETAELYSHGMELLMLDKLDTFYGDGREFRNAQREALRRSLGLLIGPLSRELFEYWIYTNPNHTSEERDRKFLEISKRFKNSPVDTSGLESEVAASWIDTTHYFLYPFYAIEYSISELGALQLLDIYRSSSERAVALYKRSAGANLNQSIAEIYRQTGVEFDFSEPVMKRTAEFLEGLFEELK